MSTDDPRAGEPDEQVPAVPPIDEDSIPARRLLAHDLEHWIWDHDDDEAAPPPD